MGIIIKLYLLNVRNLPKSILRNIVKENTEIDKYPLSGFYIIVMFIRLIMSRIMHQEND